MSAADQEDADQGAAMKANQAAAIGANQDADDLAMGQAMTANAAQAAALASGAQDDATGVDKAVAANGAAPAPTMSAAAPAPAPAGQGASPAAPANRDAMPFGKAFADAKAKGESQFTWKGKPYAVQLEKPAARDPKGAYRGDRTEVTPPAPWNAAKDSQKANVGQAAALAAPNQSSAETARLARQKPAPAAAPAPAATPAQIAARTFESVGFQDDELSRIVSLVHHR